MKFQNHWISPNNRWRMAHSEWVCRDNLPKDNSTKDSRFVLNRQKIWGTQILQLYNWQRVNFDKIDKIIAKNLYNCSASNKLKVKYSRFYSVRRIIDGKVWHFHKQRINSFIYWLRLASYTRKKHDDPDPHEYVSK